MIVILGILASIAIPRLAATREDAEISTTIANLRTLVSEASSYYVAHGTFTDANWNDITNVPLHDNATSSATGNVAHLAAGGKPCIGVQLVNKAGDTPAHIVFSKNTDNSKSGVCKQVVEAEPVDAYFKSKIGSGESDKSKMAVGSSKGVYKSVS